VSEKLLNNFYEKFHDFGEENEQSLTQKHLEFLCEASIKHGFYSKKRILFFLAKPQKFQIVARALNIKEIRQQITQFFVPFILSVNFMALKFLER
jgi:hypothetical protein